MYWEGSVSLKEHRFFLRAIPVVICYFAISMQVHAQPDWVEFTNETASRIVAAPNVSTNDVAEKDYIWGDVDQDGDIDLICVRKLAFTTGGASAFRTNVLFMNQGGVLVDRTSDFASSSDVAGDNGFLTPTNDRDVILADVTGDGWLDIVTAVTLADAAISVTALVSGKVSCTRMPGYLSSKAMHPMAPPMLRDSALWMPETSMEMEISMSTSVITIVEEASPWTSTIDC